jgi:hypothetical protein
VHLTSSSNITIDDLVIGNIDLIESIRKSFTRDPFEHYVNGICGLFFCILGMISNALSFSILIRRTMHLSTYVYLAGLCLSDFTTCLFLIPGYILDAYPIEIPDFELPRTYNYTKLLIIAGAISTTTRVLSVWLCVAFTIDRWISMLKINVFLFKIFLLISDMSSICWSTLLYNEKCSICNNNYIYNWHFLCSSTSI